MPRPTEFRTTGRYRPDIRDQDLALPARFHDRIRTCHLHRSRVRTVQSTGCFQTSISAYYYTPVHGVFIGALVAVGTCLICLRGNTDAEDILLNLAGMFAPVVALVPTPGTGSCGSVLTTADNRDVKSQKHICAARGRGGSLVLSWRSSPSWAALGTETGRRGCASSATHDTSRLGIRRRDVRLVPHVLPGHGALLGRDRDVRVLLGRRHPRRGQLQGP